MYCKGIGGHVLALETEQESDDVKTMFNAPRGKNMEGNSPNFCIIQGCPCHSKQQAKYNLQQANTHTLHTLHTLDNFIRVAGDRQSDSRLERKTLKVYDNNCQRKFTYRVTYKV